MTLDEIKRLRELERAARALIEEWDRFSGPEIWREDAIEPGGGYYSPSGRMLGSDFVAALRRALPIKTPPSHGEVEADDPGNPCGVAGGSVSTTNAGGVGLEAPAHWRPIESAPRDGTVVMLAGVLARVVGIGAWYAETREVWERVDETTKKFVGIESSGYWNAQDGDGVCLGQETITHWMPMPPLPGESQ